MAARTLLGAEQKLKSALSRRTRARLENLLQRKYARIRRRAPHGGDKFIALVSFKLLDLFHQNTAIPKLPCKLWIWAGLEESVDVFVIVSAGSCHPL